MRFTKKQLDNYSTIFGLIGAISLVFTTNDILDKRVGGTITGVCTALVSYCVQKPTKEENNND